MRGNLGYFSEQMYSAWELWEEEYWREIAPENPVSVDAPDMEPIPYIGDFYQIHPDVLSPNPWTERDNDDILFESEYFIAEYVQDISPMNVNVADVNVSVIAVTSTSVTLDLFFNPRHDPTRNALRYHDFTIPHPQFTGAWVPVLGQHSYGLPLARSGIHTITGLTPGATYRFEARIRDSVRAEWIRHEVRVTLPGAQAPSFNIVSATQTSFTFDVTFPVEGNWGNRVEIRQDGLIWADATGMGRNARSGRYTFHNLSPGRTYSVFFTFHNRETETWWTGYTAHFNTQLPPEQLQRFVYSNIIFYLDQVKIDAMGQTRANNFMAATNQSFDIVHQLVGGNRPIGNTQMELRSVRCLPCPYEGLALWRYIEWQTSTYSRPGRFLVAIDHAHEMSHFNANTTETPIFLVAQVFDHPRWTFCLYVFARFFTYYYYYRSGQSMVVAGTPRIFHGGAGFKDYMKSYSRRIGQPSYNCSIARGFYSPYGMAWNLANIQTQIGWEPFYQTFAHLWNLPLSQMFLSDIDKLNYFLSRLQDYSGQNVFAMFNANERAVYEAHFGGTMQYVPRELPPSISANPDYWNALYTGGSADFVVTATHQWQFSGATSWLRPATTRTGAVTFTADPNPTNNIRTAHITFRLSNVLPSHTHVVTVTQLAHGTWPVDVRGPNVISCFGRLGYIDFHNDRDQGVRCVSRDIRNRPVWYFVRFSTGIYLIRNNTTGRYLTEDDTSIRLEERISGTGHFRQRWRVFVSEDGSARIQSVLNSRFITDSNGHGATSPLLTLTVINAAGIDPNRQRWWIGPIWNCDSI